MKEALDLRYTMVPYIYTQARIAYDTGVSLCRPLYYEWPNDNEAYKHGEEYMFGNDILATPIVERADENGVCIKKIWLPEGTWYEVNSGKVLEGNTSYTRSFTQSDIPHYYKAGAIIPHFPKLLHLKVRPDNLILRFAPGTSGELSYYEDENDNDNYQEEAYSFTRITQELTGQEGIYTIYPVEGRFEGMLAERSYTLELLAVTIPEEVNVNGVSYSKSHSGDAGTWSYDAEKKIAKICIPKISCNDKTEVKVKFSTDETGIDTVDYKKKASLIYLPESNRIDISMTVASQAVQLVLSDISGKICLSDTFEDTQYITLQLPLNLPKGVYIVRLNYDGEKQIEKLIL